MPSRRAFLAALAASAVSSRALFAERAPSVITVYKDRSFTFITRTPPASDLLKKAAGLVKGSGVPHKDKVGKITKAQLKDIAAKKMTDLNAADLNGAISIIEGTARSMGIVIQ